MKAIHPRTPEHWAHARRLLALYAETIRETPCFDSMESDLEMLERRYGGKRGKAWIGAADGDDFAGVVLLEFEGDRGVVKRLFVEPRARGKGLARRLVLGLIGCSGGRELRLETLDSMTEAHGLYRSMGFVETAVEGSTKKMRRPPSGSICGLGTATLKKK